MTVLIIDYRERGKLIADALKCDGGHKIVLCKHFNGTENGIGMDPWCEGTRNECEELLKSVSPDLVLMHVGEDQYKWPQCLSGVYRRMPVVCYSGSMPEEAISDCAKNPRHAYCRQPVSALYPDKDTWVNSIEGRHIMQSVNSIGGDWVKAKQVLQEYNSELEEALCSLNDSLHSLIVDGSVSNDDHLNELIAKRDALLGGH